MLSQIIEGWKNHLLPKEELQIKIDEVYQKRISICNQCPKKKGLICGECGCVLIAKTKCLSCECPLQKWLSEISIEDELKLID